MCFSYFGLAQHTSISQFSQHVLPAIAGREAKPAGRDCKENHSARSTSIVRGVIAACVLADGARFC
jgi:hypothetical protein